MTGKYTYSKAMDEDDLYELLDWCDEGDLFIMHRGEGNHVPFECWCYPLELPVDYVMEAEPEVLKELLEQFFRIH